MWLSLVERIVRDDEAAGSNPVTPIFYSEKRERKDFVTVCIGSGYAL